MDEEEEETHTEKEERASYAGGSVQSDVPPEDEF